MRSRLAFSASFLWLILLAPTARAQHLDIAPSNVGGVIVTGGHDDALGNDLPLVRVFGLDFAEDPGDPFFIGDPGFNAPAGSGLLNTQLFFDILGPATGSGPLPFNLSYWDGTGPVVWGDVPDNEQLRLNFGAQNRLVGDGRGLIAGFSLGTPAIDGSLHRHLNTFLQDELGNESPAATPTDGIYAIAMQLRQAGLTTSEPFWVVFNLNMSEAVHEQAMASLVAVPEPASVVLGGLGLVGIAWYVRRRRRGAESQGDG